MRHEVDTKELREMIREIMKVLSKERMMTISELEEYLINQGYLSYSEVYRKGYLKGILDMLMMFNYIDMKYKGRSIVIFKT